MIKNDKIIEFVDKKDVYFLINPSVISIEISCTNLHDLTPKNIITTNKIVNKIINFFFIVGNNFLVSIEVFL